MIIRIPDDYIEDADEYKVMPIDTYIPLEIGGRIMKKMVILDQMKIENIIATTGLKHHEGKKGSICLVIVSYTRIEVVAMIRKAKLLTGKLIDEGGSLDGN